MPEKVTTAVIAAAGQATRMWPASKVISKEFFPLGRIPAIVHVIWELIDAGIDKIIIVAAAHNSSSLTALFDPSQEPPKKVAHDPLVKRFQESLLKSSVSVIEQSGIYGTATPLQEVAAKFGPRPYLYAFGDDIILGGNPSQAMIQIYESTDAPVMAGQEVMPARRGQFGILEYEDRDGFRCVTRLVEKPGPNDTFSTLASFGRYLVTPALLEGLRAIRPSHDGEMRFVDAVTTYLEKGGLVRAYNLDQGNWYTVGDPKSYATAVMAATSGEFSRE